MCFESEGEPNAECAPGFSRVDLLRSWVKKRKYINAHTLVGRGHEDVSIKGAPPHSLPTDPNTEGAATVTERPPKCHTDAEK